MKLWGKTKVEGFIAFYGLTDWWLTTFTDAERRYMDERYQPLGLPYHTLTQGKRSSSKSSSEFLNELSTWFKGKKDVSIAERIHEKVDKLGQSLPVEGPGYYKGRHFTTYVSDVENLKKAGKLEDAKILLLDLVKTTEEDDRITRSGVAPWYYEELAKIYRKQKDYSSEVAILERYAEQRHAPGAKPAQLMERLNKAKQLLEKSS